MKNELRFGLSPDQEAAILDKAKKIFMSAKSDRDEYESDWRVLSSQFMPHLLKLDDNNRTKRSKWAGIINNTPRQAVKTLQAGMTSGLTSAARPWLQLGVEDLDLMEYGPVREWLEFGTKRMLSLFARSNFYSVAPRTYGVCATFGTAAELHLSDIETAFRFESLMTGRYWIGLNARKIVDRLFIQMNLSAYQMMEMFGKERLPMRIVQAYDNGNYNQMERVMLGIMPNPFPKWDRDGYTLISSNQKKFVSVYWIESENTALKTAGYDRFPAQVPRWETTDDEAYGIGCGHDAIGDSKAIQLKETEKAKGIKKMVAPPTSAPYEMRNAQYPVSGLPGGVTYRAPNTNADQIQPLYEVRLPINYLYEDIKLDEGRVDRAFFADLFLMLAMSDRRQITAFEIAEKKEEKLLALGPALQNFHHEYLDPKIERNFEIMMTNNLLPPPPEEIQGMALKVDYIGVLSQAQAQVGIGAINSLLTFTGNLEKLFPNKGVGDKVDLDQAVDEVGRMYGVPTKIIVSDDKVAGIRDNRAQMQAQQMQMQMAMAGADAASKLAKSPSGDSTVLDKMVGA